MNNVMGAWLATALLFPMFMSGSWSSEVNGVRMEEHWTSAAGGLMLGMHRDIGRKTSFEFMRIEQVDDGSLVYQAQPSGRSATPFKLKSMSESRVVFENLDHDFPQRIIYWRKAEQLCARVEGTIGGKPESEEWCWNRSK
jgi:hypothetical protein